MTTRKHRFTFKALSILLALAFVLSAAPRAVAAQSACADNYTVKAGDTLYGISFSYNIAMDSLAKANNLVSPYLLTIGQRLCIPSGATLPTGTTTGTTGSTSKSKDPALLITRTEYGFTLEIANFTPRNIYYVRVGESGLRTLQWRRLGLVHIDKNGAAAAYYRLPKRLIDATTLHICLKNARTNGVICVRA